MKRIRCISCGKINRIYKQPIRQKNGLYKYDYMIPRFCPFCGNMLPNYLRYVNDFFNIYDLNPKLNRAKRLLMKSEFEAVCRECFVVLENEIKNISGVTNQHGSELVSKVFSMKYDKTSNTITQQPIIAINSLSNESEINEQDGIMHMLMGFFRGPRNIYQHNQVRLGFNMSFSILIETSFYLDIISKKQSLLSKPYWKRTIMESPEEIYHKMSNSFYKISYLYDCIKKGYYIPFWMNKEKIMAKKYLKNRGKVYE